MEPYAELPCEAVRQLYDFTGQFVTRLVAELHAHPAYVRHCLAVPACKLSALAGRGDLAFQQPLVVTRGGIIIDGYARWELARLQGRVTLPCIQYELTEAEALDWLLGSHRRSDGLNAFCRILLASDCEHDLKERARSNQRAGGKSKGSSNLTEAETLDVRAQIAAAAGVSVGNVSKVKQLIRTACPELLQALRDGDISIHWAAERSKLPGKEQREALWFYQNRHALKKTARNLISQHQAKTMPSVPTVGTVVRRLSVQEPYTISTIAISVIKVPGRILCVSEELLQMLGAQEELELACDSNTP